MPSAYSAYSTEAWGDFFVASTGATAALAGLLFVGMSVNLTRIITGPGLPGPAAETLIVLGGALAVSLVGLAPGLDRRVLGLIILAVAAGAWAAVIRLQWRAPRVPGHRRVER